MPSHCEGRPKRLIIIYKISTVIELAVYPAAADGAAAVVFFDKSFLINFPESVLMPPSTRGISDLVKSLYLGAIILCSAGRLTHSWTPSMFDVTWGIS